MMPATLPTTRVHHALPIFRLEDEGRTLFYTPGHAIATDFATAADIERALSDASDGDSVAHDLARTLEQKGRTASDAWQRLAFSTFEPECLTLYLSNRCNLGCVYCYAAPAEDGRARKRLRMYSAADADAELPILPEATVYAAAKVVARNCAARGRPLTLVLHGGGEPTLHWDLLCRVRQRIDEIASEHGIGVWAYIATHGVMPEDRARWLAQHFNLIGLSCDGPPDVQNANRPTAGGAGTAEVVERTARILSEQGAAFTVRMTITPQSVARQEEIVRYAVDRLHATSVRFEPAYEGRRRPSPSAFVPEQAETFVGHFLSARNAARALGADLQVSGVRMNEIHGPYCNPLREVLQITPDGVATACFLSTGEGRPEDAAMALGALNLETGEFEINQSKAQQLRREAASIPARCESCVNLYHCARDCPDVCLMTAGAADEPAGFRCRVQKALAHQQIRELAS
jgi:radical SAM protein with 4Fe4S-binding SPASM domain